MCYIFNLLENLHPGVSCSCPTGPRRSERRKGKSTRQSFSLEKVFFYFGGGGRWLGPERAQAFANVNPEFGLTVFYITSTYLINII